MAVASASTADIIIVEEEEEDVHRSSPTRGHAVRTLPRRVQLSTSTHVTKSPFASTSKNNNILEAENNKLFAEFVAHVTSVTQDCPEVLEFLKTNHAKACPKYLLSVEFRNSLGRCLTRVESNRSKMFVYIYELCMVLRQHKDRTRRKLKKPSTLESGSSTSVSGCLQSTSLNGKTESTVGTDKQEQLVFPKTEDEKPSTSKLQEEQEKAEKKASRASRKQIAYLENLLKVYADEINRLQRAELSLDDMDAEDSLYIQEHKLKRKMMMIYKKLCELKDCTPLTGRILERKIAYANTSYPEIGKKIQRYINSPEVCMNPPDYQDILQQVQQASKRHNLHLSRKQLELIARKAFTDTGTKIQQRRYQDLLYDFGCQLTSEYKPENDPALKNPALLRKLKDNQELGVNRLEDVINKYANQQEDMDEKDRLKQQGKEEEEEDEEEDDDMSSETDIEEEIQASSLQNGPDDNKEDGNEEDVSDEGSDEAEELSNSAVEELSSENIGIVEADNTAVTSEPPTDGNVSDMAPLSEVTHVTNGSGQSEPTQLCMPSPDEGAIALEEPLHPADQVTTSQSSGTDPPESGMLEMICHSPITNGTCTPHRSMSDNKLSRKNKRKRLDFTPNRKNSEVEVLLDMGVICVSPPQTNEESDLELVSSSHSPPAKKNKVNVATQCDPEEIIELSDSD
ncbi:death domain-associated protein 6 isoform X2 [Corythoichthys intestinalis]|uniref:death domain-associated protein 6 isoform X2 n=1 Tax=Corythoichthys intestinalis TaxID=161448 RepID=UPI0025A5BF59|nr:death domain-associated protein 6 isoform X2 [Corythoichthys intestinalis]